MFCLRAMQTFNSTDFRQTLDNSNAKIWNCQCYLYGSTVRIWRKQNWSRHGSVGSPCKQDIKTILVTWYMLYNFFFCLKLSPMFTTCNISHLSIHFSCCLASFRLKTFCYFVGVCHWFLSLMMAHHSDCLFLFWLPSVLCTGHILFNL